MTETACDLRQRDQAVILFMVAGKCEVLIRKTAHVHAMIHCLGVRPPRAMRRLGRLPHVAARSRKTSGGPGSASGRQTTGSAVSRSINPLDTADGTEEQRQTCTRSILWADNLARLTMPPRNTTRSFRP